MDKLNATLVGVARSDSMDPASNSKKNSSEPEKSIKSFFNDLKNLIPILLIEN